MRERVCLETIEYLSQFCSCIVDPCAGVGSTMLGCSVHNAKSVSIEAFRPYHRELLNLAYELDGDHSVHYGSCFDAASYEEFDYDGVFLSPIFPRSHSPGKTENQKELQEGMKLYGGTEFDLELSNEWGVGAIPDLGKWRNALTRTAVAATAGRDSGLVVAIHIKDYIEKGLRIDMCGVVKEALEEAGLVPYQYLKWPLQSLSGFNNWKRYPRRKIEKWIDDTTALLNCGHFKTYKKLHAKRPAESHCIECGVDESVSTVNSEEVVLSLLP